MAERSTPRVKDTAPAGSNYKQKYEHLIGRDAGVKAADTMSTNKAYGFGRNNLHLSVCDSLDVSETLFAIEDYFS